MKSHLVKLLTLLVSISIIGLVGCSSRNTRDQNTAIGAVTGAVVGGAAGSLIGGGAGQAVAIGVGAIAGGLIGAGIGYEMDSSDNAHVVYVMDRNAPYHPGYWRNPRTGYSYRVMPESGHMKMHGYANCRKFSTTAMIKGKKRHVHGVACRQKDGSWKAV